MTDPIEKMQFEAETRQLLELMIHSLYSNKEVFLRELISNSSDAIDRRRFEALTDPAIAEGFGEGEIRFHIDEEARTLTVSDNGIGMTREDVISNIGTIARSGTQELMKMLKQSKAEGAPTELIGQFGVGFYSCFMVADKVTLTTRRAGEETATVWEYSGGGEFQVSPGSRSEPGTSVVLHLKDADPEDGLSDFTAQSILRRTVKKYSDFVRYPIVLPVSHEEGEEGKKETVVEDEVLNSMKAIWLRSEKEVTDEERAQFYKHIAHDWTEPLTHFSLRAEGRLEYQALLFVPAHAPFDLFSQAYKRGLQLYVRNVKIMDHCEDLLPEYLRFIKGVVDAQDLPLNVSREILQNNRQISQIRSALTKKAIETLGNLKKNDGEKYKELWEQFGAVIKEGVSSDPNNKDKLLEFIQFQSTNHSEELTTLFEYVSRMKDDQKTIYYLSGEQREIVERSPHLEAFSKRGLEVLLFTDPIDEFMVHAIGEYNEKKLESVGKGEVSLGDDEEKDELARDAADHDEFLKALQKELDDHVKEVRLTGRLTDSPVCLVGDPGDLSPHIQRLLVQNKMQVPDTKRIMELNPKHEVIIKFKKNYEDGPEGFEFADIARLLYGQALLAESTPLPDPVEFAGLITKMMLRSS